MKEFTKSVSAHNSKTRCKVCYSMPSHSRSKPVVKCIGYASTNTRLATPVSSTHYHIKTLIQFFEQAIDICRIVLTITVHKNESVSTRSAGATFYGGTIAHGIWGG